MNASTGSIGLADAVSPLPEIRVLRVAGGTFEERGSHSPVAERPADRRNKKKKKNSDPPMGLCLSEVGEERFLTMADQPMITLFDPITMSCWTRLREERWGHPARKQVRRAAMTRRIGFASSVARLWFAHAARRTRRPPRSDAYFRVSRRSDAWVKAEMARYARSEGGWYRHAWIQRPRI